MSMKTSEVLDLAADKIQSRGWTRFQGWNSGPELAGIIGTGLGGELCLEGALMAAMGLSLDSRGVDPWSVETCPAYVAMQEYLGDAIPESVSRRVLNGNSPLYMWNDHVAQTGSEVIEVLRAAAAVERVKEAAYSTKDEPLPLEVAA